MIKSCFDVYFKVVKINQFFDVIQEETIWQVAKKFPPE
jgi:hypothetical protein